MADQTQTVDRTKFDSMTREQQIELATKQYSTVSARYTKLRERLENQLRERLEEAENTAVDAEDNLRALLNKDELPYPDLLVEFANRKPRGRKPADAEAPAKPKG